MLEHYSYRDKLLSSKSSSRYTGYKYSFEKAHFKKLANTQKHSAYDAASCYGRGY